MAIITEDYVSFETAKILKEKGFNEGCRAHYGTAGSFSYEKYEVEASGCEMHNAILAPTLQMAMKWLREVHDLFIEMCIQNNGSYIGYIYNTNSFGLVGWDKRRVSSSYEEACEIAIKYCLENLI